MPTFRQYNQSPLYAGVVQLLANLDLIKQNPNYATGTTQQEKNSIAYLNNLHETVTALHHKILPIFSEGGQPGLFDMPKLVKFNGLASQLKKTTKPTIDVMLDYEVACSLMIFIESIPDGSLSAIAPFLNVKKTPDIGKAYVNKFFGMEFFDSSTKLQADLRLKKQTLQAHIANFEEVHFNSHRNNIFQIVKSPLAAIGSMFRSRKPSIDITPDVMDKRRDSLSPHTPTVG